MALRRTWLHAILGLVLLAWLFRAVLFGDELLIYRDAGHFYYPLFLYVQQEWESGRIPLWCPHEAGGIPLLADNTSCVFYPGKLLLFLPLPYDVVYQAYIVLHVVMAVGVAYRLARYFGSSVDAAALAGIGYGFSGIVFFQYCNPVFLVGAAWLPAAIECLDRTLTRRSLPAAAATGFCLAMMVLGGDPQMAYNTGLVGAGYALILWRQKRRGTTASPSAAEPDLGTLVPTAQRATAAGPQDQPPSGANVETMEPGVSGAQREPSTDAATLGQPTHAATWGVQGDHPMDATAVPSFGPSAAPAPRALPDEEPASDAPIPSAPPGDDAAAREGPARWWRHRLVLLAVAAASAGSLSAVQVLPSVELAQHATRSMFEVPRSIYEVPAYMMRDRAGGRHARRPWYEVLLGKSSEEGQETFTYDFCIEPWRMLELLWPGCSGTEFPFHRRWILAIQAEGRIWTPTIYMSAALLVLGLSALRLRRTDARTCWMSWIFVLGILASLGPYAPGWIGQLVAEFGFGTEPKDLPFGAPLGGVYWFMVTFLPGYMNFRYPAKLMVLVALALSLLAARGCDASSQATWRMRMRRNCMALLLVSAMGVLAALIARAYWSSIFLEPAVHRYLGRLDRDGAWWDLLLSFVHGGAALGGLWWLLGPRWAPRPRLRGALLVALVCVDLAVAQRGLVRTVPSQVWHQPSLAAQRIRRHAAEHGITNYRLWRNPELPTPAHWLTEPSATRYHEVIAWERATLQPRHALAERLYTTRGSPTIPIADFELFVNLANWSADAYRLVPDPRVRSDALTRWERIDDAAFRAAAPSCVLLFNRQWLPRTWLVRDVRVLPPLASRSFSRIEQRSLQVLQAIEEPATTAVVETDEPLPYGLGPADAAAARLLGEETCRLLADESTTLELHVRLQQPALLIVADVYYPGWEARVATDGQPARPTPIYRVNRCFRGVALPAGDHRVQFAYRPVSFRAGGAISLAAWLLLACGALSYAVRRWTHRGESQ